MEFGSLPESTFSAETFSSIQKWLRDCLEGHPHWDHDPLLAREGPQLGDPRFLPTRLVYIDQLRRGIRIVDSRDVQIGADGVSIETKPSSSGYMALSYRWGKTSGLDHSSQLSSMLLLTSSTENRLRAGVPFSNIPQTILDACTVVSRLGYSYLWVDRLCIFQDSSEDWAREASQMGLIYGNAVLTIAASCARNEHSGFLRLRSPKPEGIVPFTLRQCPFPPPPALVPEDEHPEDFEESQNCYYYIYGASPLRPTGRCRDGFLVNRG